MNLAASQRAFLAEIAADDSCAPASPGMAIYRNAYRARLSDALADGFERTARWAGEQSFAAAAAHYILTHPPGSWTLDAYGARFPAVLAELFAAEPDVAELAWLEWHMQQAFAAPDCGTLTAADLAAANLRDEDWPDVRFAMASGFACRLVCHDVPALWHSLASESSHVGAATPTAEQPLIVWRKALQPHFRLLDRDEFAVLAALACGQTLGEAASQGQAEQLGPWLALWLGEGLFSGFTLPDEH